MSGSVGDANAAPSSKKGNQSQQQQLPKKKRFAPAFIGLPGRGEIKQYQAYYSEGMIWVLDTRHALDLSLRGSYGKGLSLMLLFVEAKINKLTVYFRHFVTFCARFRDPTGSCDSKLANNGSQRKSASESCNCEMEGNAQTTTTTTTTPIKFIINLDNNIDNNK